MLPDYPSPSIRLWVCWFQWLLFSTRVPYLRDGVTPAGSRFVCPRSKRRFSVPVWVRSTGQSMVGPHASVCGVSARPVPPGVLPDGPRCVRELRLSLAPSSVLPCPMLGFRVASATLAAGLGLSWVPCPSSAGWGFVPRLVAWLAPCSRWRPLTGWSSLTLRVVGGSWFSPLCSPGRRSASRSTYSALPPVSGFFFWAWSLLLRVRLRPLPDDSLGALWLPVLLLWSSLRLRVGEGSSLSAWSFPFGGLSPFSRLFLSWRPCRSRSLFPSLAPSWWWPCPLLRWSLLALSGYFVIVPSAVFFASVSLIDPVALSPLLHRVFADGFRHWCAFRLCGGASLHALGSVGALGELRWLHLYRLKPDLVGLRQFAVWLWSSGRCFLFSCATFRASP